MNLDVLAYHSSYAQELLLKKIHVGDVAYRAGVQKRGLDASLGVGIYADGNYDDAKTPILELRLL